MTGMSFALILAGAIIASIFCFIPMNQQIAFDGHNVVLLIPEQFKMIIGIIGIAFAVVGYMMIYLRLRYTNAIYLVRRGRPGQILWFYVYADGEIRITPSIRAGEKQLYNADLDAQVIDVKTYSMADHKIRIVPEIVGHAVDLDYVTYVTIAESKWGWENLKEARECANWVLKKLGIKKQTEIEATEHVAVGRDIEKLQKKIREQHQNNEEYRRTSKLPGTN